MIDPEVATDWELVGAERVDNLGVEWGVEIKVTKGGQCFGKTHAPDLKPDTNSVFKMFMASC